MKKNQSPYRETEDQNINRDFFKNVFNYLALSYGVSSDPLIYLNFPENSEKTANEEKSSSFQSRIVDLRLRRQQEYFVQLQKEKNEKISSSIEEVYQKLINNSEDIDDVFEAEKANREEVPLYLRNIDLEIKNEERYQKVKKSPKPMNMKSIKKEYSNRLERSQLTGTRRAEKRVLKMQMYSMENSAQNYVGKNEMYNEYDE